MRVPTISALPGSVTLVALLAVFGLPQASVTASAADLHALVESVARKACAENPDYHAIADVSCADLQQSPGETDPDAVLQEIGTASQQEILALSRQARREDAACAQGVVSTVAGGTKVGPANSGELATSIVHHAVESAVTLNPAALMLSIPGVTQVQYDYKGLANGPEVRTFRIAGHLEGQGTQAKLYLKMDGHVDGDPNLYVQYTVNLRTTKSPFPAWSPFLDGPADVHPSFVRQGLDTISAVADFSEQGEHRNGVKPWHQYTYSWHAEKVGAAAADIVKKSGGAITDLSPYPYGGDWVGWGSGTETRFEQTRQGFVGQFSPAAASAMTGDAASGVIMSLNVKHETTFYFHVDFDGNVTGRGVIVYTLDPNLCGVAVLTRQVNEQVNFMKYLPVAFAAAAQLGRLAVTRFESTWATESTQITQKIDQFIETLPPKIDPAEGMKEVTDFLAAHPGIRKGGNMAFADVDVSGFPKGRLWRRSGRVIYPDMPDVVPVPEGPSAFKTGDWAQEFKRDPSQWDSVPYKEPYTREFDSERMIMEYLAKKLPADASGTIRIYSKYPVCPRCAGVIEQFYCLFPKITLLVTSGG